MQNLNYYINLFLLKNFTPQKNCKTYLNRLDKLCYYYRGDYLLTTKAKLFATMLHRSVNQKYDNNKEYSVHLLRTFRIAKRYRTLVDASKLDIVYAASWLHDTIEDCRINYSLIYDEFGKEVADIVFDLTNEKGKTRKERANDKYYKEIKNNNLSIFVKLCDRISNLNYSYYQYLDNHDLYKKLKMYSNENKHFTESLYTDKYKIMFENLAEISNIFADPDKKTNI